MRRRPLALTCQQHASRRGLTSPICVQIPTPLVTVIRHMNATARQATLDAMLRIGPDTSGFSAYSPTFSFSQSHARVHHLWRDGRPPENLVHDMELIAAPALQPEATPLTLRAQVYALLSHPSSSRAARVASLVILSGISVSTAAYCYDTMPGVPRGPGEAAWLHAVEVATVALFTTEYLARLACCPRLRQFLTSPMNAIDVLSVLPYFVSLLSEQLLGGTLLALHGASMHVCHACVNGPTVGSV